MKLFKTLLAIPVVCVIFTVMGLTFVAPLFVSLLTEKIYEEYVPSTWKAITYPVCIVAEIALVAAFLMDRTPIIYVVLTLIVWFHCAISSICFRAKQKCSQK